MARNGELDVYKRQGIGNRAPGGEGMLFQTIVTGVVAAAADQAAVIQLTGH